MTAFLSIDPKRPVAWQDSGEGSLHLPEAIEVWWWDGSTLPEVSALSPDEQRDLGRLPSSRRQFFLQARAFPRLVLARYLNMRPSDIPLCRSSAGKPAVQQCPEIHFNLSHTTSGFLFAVAPVEVGVDVEAVARRVSFEEISRKFFSASEQAWLHEVDLEERGRRFIYLWTAKEAALKCLGLGIPEALRAIPICPSDQTTASYNEKILEIRHFYPTESLCAAVASTERLDVKSWFRM